MSSRLIVMATLAAVVLLGTGVVRACSVDGVPSLSVNGRLVAVNKSNVANDSWTPFVAPGRYAAHHALALREDRARVAAALPPVAFKFPWRWRLGDGATAHGTAVNHVYRHPGAYIVSVEAYFVVGAQKQWFTFDKVTLHIR